MSFYAIGIDPTESLDNLERYKAEQKHPWPVATAPFGMLADYDIKIQSTKVAIDGKGIIAYREGYGGGFAENWHRLFQDLGVR